MSQAIEAIVTERERQKSLVFDGQPSTVFDKENTQNDWIVYITRYVAAGAPKLQHRKDMEFRQAMVKVGALAAAAIENFDAGHCPE